MNRRTRIRSTSVLEDNNYCTAVDLALEVLAVQHSTTSLNIDTGFHRHFSHPPVIIRVALCRVVWLRHRRDGRLPRLIFEGRHAPAHTPLLRGAADARFDRSVCNARGAHRQRRQQHRRVGSRAVGPRTVSTAARRARRAR